MAENNEQLPPIEEQARDDSVPALVNAEEDIKSKKVTLADLSAKGTALYAQRKYEEAAEHFSEASGLQAEINGETAPENAEILFHYGRSLFKLGQSKSDVLGGQAPANKKNGKANGKDSVKKTVGKEVAKAEEKTIASAGEAGASGKAADSKTATPANNPLFQFTGDENFDESDEEEVDAEDEEDGEEDDDLANAFEVLDLARVCYIKLLEKPEEDQSEGKGKEAAQQDSPAIRHVKERLADTHDALSEISLENERYQNAIEDGRVSLKYKMELYPEESEIIAEAHYKLSLSLEFASVTTTGGAEGGAPKREEMDQGLRDEAVYEMEQAIKSFRLKMQNKEVELATMASPEDNDLARKDIAEMKEVIAEMDQRLTELRNDPIDTKKLLGEDNPITGLFGALAGESNDQAKERVNEATKNATDLSSLVRKKGKAPEKAASPTNVSETSNKRKAEDEVEEESAKKAKVETSAEA